MRDAGTENAKRTKIEELQSEKENREGQSAEKVCPPQATYSFFVLGNVQLSLKFATRYYQFKIISEVSRY